ncbi:MAG: DUF4349 domain-containing protein [Anaerolineaceae bacterium]
MRKSIIVIMLFSMLFLAGCASSRNATEQESTLDFATGNEGGLAVAPMPAMPTEASAAPMADEGKGLAITERMVVRTAQMRVSVADPAVAVSEVSRLAESYGGFVVSSNIYETSRTETMVYQGSYITIRVPSAKLDEVMAKIRAQAADPKSGVMSESISGQDVTSEYVDSEARLKNLEAAEVQLKELLDNAPDLEYTMDVFRELTSVREQIEVIKGRMQYLKESTDLSAISVDFVAEASLKPIEIGGWKPEGTAREAVQALINSAQKVVDALIWFGIYCLPFLIPVAVVVYFIVKSFKKRRSERLAKQFMEPKVERQEPPPTNPQ